MYYEHNSLHIVTWPYMCVVCDVYWPQGLWFASCDLSILTEYSSLLRPLTSLAQTRILEILGISLSVIDEGIMKINWSKSPTAAWIAFIWINWYFMDTDISFHQFSRIVFHLNQLVFLDRSLSDTFLQVVDKIFAHLCWQMMIVHWIVVT